MNLDPVILTGIAWFLGAILALAGLHKFLQSEEFLGALDGYGLLPQAALQPAALMLGSIELGLALALVTPWTMANVAPAVAALFAIYALVVASAVARGRTGLDCGCEWGKQGGSTIGWGAALRALSLAVLALICIVPASRPMGWFEIANGAFAGLAAAIMFHGWSIAKANFRHIAAIRGKGAVA